ncbi:protein S100-B [Nycticebus coucang]|uniref:protein S100-B n=1 Tax=Nycticebus coucang TaxID=9470 RepID=UPI00234D81E7|nr:protein S100-B [Nycticebus coucang]
MSTEKAVVALSDGFQQYSGREGDRHKIKKLEFKDHTNNKLSGNFSYLSWELREKEVVDKDMKTLDNDRDGECDFQKFMAFPATVTNPCSKLFEQK